MEGEGQYKQRSETLAATYATLNVCIPGIHYTLLWIERSCGKQWHKQAFTVNKSIHYCFTGVSVCIEYDANKTENRKRPVCLNRELQFKVCRI